MADGQLIFDLLPHARAILDVGSPGAHWWSKVPAEARVLALDLYRGLLQTPPNVKFRRFDVHWLAGAAAKSPNPLLKLYLGEALHEQFDLVVADHLLEHVKNPEMVLRGCFDACTPGGKLHVGIPDGEAFTDRFYHLALTDGGGHLYRFTKQSLIDMAERAGFRLVQVDPWADDWLWFAEGYNPRLYRNKMLRKADIAFMTEVFRTELTPEKGYLYGYEYVFEKPT